MDSTWLNASKIAIRIVEDNRLLESPAIVCTRCDACLTILADMDTVASADDARGRAHLLSRSDGRLIPQPPAR